MANFEKENIEIEAIACAVPKKREINKENKIFTTIEVEDFIKTTGVEEFRVAPHEVTTSDLAYAAANELFTSSKISRDEIDILIFVSQTPDYLFIPNTAPILQHKLGLSMSCMSFDVPLGCSGFVYGLNIASSLLSNKSLRKALVICGDTPSKTQYYKDKSVAMLFGDAVSAVILTRSNSESKISFSMGSDGSGYKAIMIPDGGYRSPFNNKSLDIEQGKDGNYRRACDVVLDGMDVFSFGITRAPKSVKEILTFSNIEINTIDFFVFHQANLMMNELIRKKLKIPIEKVPYSIIKYGNTSSASIPLTIVTELGPRFSYSNINILACGFGVGLSWGSMIFKLSNTLILPIIEL